MFEATGLGSCLISDYGSNICDLFEPDSEIATYKSLPEAIEKFRFLTGNEVARRSMAEAGQKKTLERHTGFQRGIELDQIISENI